MQLMLNSIAIRAGLMLQRRSSARGALLQLLMMEAVSAASGHAGYVLREKPIKISKFLDSDSNNYKGMLRQEAKTCRECGKGFQSLKALYGHMRCHPKRQQISNSLDDDSWSDGKKEDAATSSFPVFEVDQEQIEGALCLMMLSRDLGRWDGFDSIEAESSDNGLEAQSRSSGLGMLNNGKGDENFDFACDEDFENLKSPNIKKPRFKKLEYVDSGSGFLRVGLKKIESEVSAKGIIRDDHLKKIELEDVDLRKNFFSKNKSNRKRSKLDYSEDEIRKDTFKEGGMDRADLSVGEYNGSGKKNINAYYTEIDGDSEIFSDTQKRGRFKCTTCNKTFHSHQALGGHRSSHTKIKACFASRIESSVSSIETQVSADPSADSKLNKSCSNETLIEEEDGDINGVSEMISYVSKKNKGHECPICFQVFASGQALGGHKRSHLAGGSENRDNQTIVIQQQLPEITDPDLFDFNLPPSIEEETSDDMGLNFSLVGQKQPKS